MNLLFKISYGLFVLCAKAGKEESGCIINTFLQQTSEPETFSITVNKRNFSRDLVEQSGECVVAILSTETDFETIKRFGMQSGRTVDKFDGIDFKTTNIGIKVPYIKGIMGYFALKVLKTVDMGTHTMFVLSAVENKAFVESGDALTYDYYQNFIKHKPEIKTTDKTEKWVCKICGYIHEGPLPPDFICPLCKHPASDFEKVQ